LWWGSSEGLHEEEEFSLLLEGGLCRPLDDSFSIMFGEELACGMVLLLLDCS